MKGDESGSVGLGMGLVAGDEAAGLRAVAMRDNGVEWRRLWGTAVGMGPQPNSPKSLGIVSWL